MNQFFIKQSALVSKRQTASDIFLFKIRQPAVAKACHPGEFVNISVKGHSLRRPFSIFNSVEDTFSILFRVCGKGTRLLASTEKGEELSIMGPLGRGFTAEGKKPLFVAGGLGVAPLFFLALRTPSAGIFIHGTREPEEFIDMDELKEKKHKLIKVSDSKDRRTAVDLLKEHINEGDTIYTAGPRVMLKKVAELCSRENKKCYMSWEERMGCGTGLCQSCVVKINGKYKLTCSDGPVFEAAEINWDEY